jgi:hypothetical protein
VGSDWCEETLIYQPGKFQEAFRDAAEDTFHEYGHRYDGGTLYHGCDASDIIDIGTLPPRITILRFLHLIDWYEQWTLWETWWEYKPDGSVSKHRSNPIPASHRGKVLENMVKTWSRYRDESGKWDSNAIAIRPNAKEEREIKKRYGKAGTRTHVAYMGTWAPS